MTQLNRNKMGIGRAYCLSEAFPICISPAWRARIFSSVTPSGASDVAFRGADASLICVSPSPVFPSGPLMFANYLSPS